MIFETFTDVSIRYCVLGNYEALNIVEKYDVFYHFAWSGGKNRNDLEQNLDSARYSADAVKLAKKLQCKVFIGAGSQAECGSHDVAISEITICKPFNEFGLGKLFSYYWTQLMCNQLDIRHCWLRILSIYGPYDGDQTLVNSTILKILNGEQLKFTDAEQYWDFLFSDDAAEIIGMIGLSDNSSGIYVIGSGKVEKLKRFISIITNYFNIDSTPYLGLTNKAANSVKYLKADISRLENEFNWTPRISFKSGIETTVHCLKSRNG
jgi:nucleoside-diphosphate-sugar epimerase